MAPMGCNLNQAAFIDYQKDTAAAGALVGLDGLALMGVRLKCTKQEDGIPLTNRGHTSLGGYI